MEDKSPPLPSRSRYSWKTIFTPLEYRSLCACLTLLGFVILLISVITEHWLDDGRFSAGLWTTCVEPKCPQELEILVDMIEYTGITRGMMVVATICGAFSIMVITVSFFRNRIYSFSLGYVAAIACFATSIFVMIGMSVYTHELIEDKKELSVESGWSFDAGWVSFPLFFLAGSVTALLPKVER